MFKIRGGDGKEYGPVTADVLRQWVREGRVNGQTAVLAEGASNWQPLSSVPEFTALFAPPPPGMTAAVGGTPVGPVPTSGMAITSLVLGSVGFLCGITAIPGLILGILAMKKVKRSEGRLGGHGLALAGTIVSGVVLAMMLLLIPIYAALLLPALAQAKSKAQTIHCVNNLKQLSLAVLMYADDNNDTFPAGTNWCDALNGYVAAPSVYKCPSDTANARSAYAYNAMVAGRLGADIPTDTVILFESDAGWNASGRKELMITQPRHKKRVYNVAFADGRVEQVNEARLPQLRWTTAAQPEPESPQP